MADERREGPTPNGGAYAIASFHRRDGAHAERDDDEVIVIREYAADGRLIAETWGATSPEHADAAHP